jgi:hypothetical protein
LRTGLSDSGVGTEISSIKIRSHERHFADLLPWGGAIQ